MSETSSDDGPQKDYEGYALTAADFPGTLYDGDGTHLAGDGPELTLEMTESFAFKALIHAGASIEGIALLSKGDRLWVLPDTLGEPPELPIGVLTALANVVRRGHRVGLAANNRDVYVLVRSTLTLLLDDSGGRA
jgi:hypothetical protein